MVDNQWFLTEGNGSLTLRIREGLRVGEQASGFLALDDPRVINQWFRFYYSEQGELWIACLHGFSIEAGGNSELRRLRLANDTKIQLLSNEINVCQDPFNIDENINLVTVKPYFNTYVAAQDDDAVVNPAIRNPLLTRAANYSPAEKTGDFEESVRHASDETGSTAVVGDAPIDRYGSKITSSTIDNSETNSSKINPPDTKNAATDTEAEPDFYISSLWAEKAAEEKAAELSANKKASSEHLKKNELIPSDAGRRRNFRKFQVVYLASGALAGSLFSFLIIFLIFGADQSQPAKQQETLISVITPEQSSVLPEDTLVIENAAETAVSGTAQSNSEGAIIHSQATDDGVQADKAKRAVSTVVQPRDTVVQPRDKTSEEYAVVGSKASAGVGNSSELVVNEMPGQAKEVGAGSGHDEADSRNLPEDDLITKASVNASSSVSSASKVVPASEGSDSTAAAMAAKTSPGRKKGESPVEQDWRISKAENSLNNGNIISPPGKNAVAYIQSYLQDYPDSSYAISLLTQCADKLTSTAEELYRQGESFQARNTLEEVLVFEPNNKRANSLWITWHGDS